MRMVVMDHSAMFKKNAPNAKHRLCIKLMKVAKSYIKQNPCKKRKGKR